VIELLGPCWACRSRGKILRRSGDRRSDRGGAVVEKGKKVLRCCQRAPVAAVQAMRFLSTSKFKAGVRDPDRCFWCHWIAHADFAPAKLPTHRHRQRRSLKPEGTSATL